MGRLFWKFFFAFWGAVIVAGVSVGLAMHVLRGAVHHGESLAQGPRAGFMVETAALVFAQGGAAPLAGLLEGWRAHDPGVETLFALDDQDHDVLGRTPPQALITQARQAQRAVAENPLLHSGAPGRDHYPARQATGPDGQTVLLFAGREKMHEAPAMRGVVEHRAAVSAGPPPGPTERNRPPHDVLPRLPWPLLVAGLLASISFSALLAWHFVRPVRVLRQAFGAVAAGRLETRVGASMGARADEIADLGKDFDRMTEELQLQVASQRRLLHDVSHELRSPLARLQAAVGLARQDSGRMEAVLERVERESQRLNDLVGELLTLARLEAGADRGPPAAVDLCEILATVVADVRFEAQAAKRAITLSAPQECVIVGHAELLHRAMENILRNAVRHTAEGTTVEVFLELPAKGPAIIRFSDRGPGVALDDCDAIFHPFYRGPDCGDKLPSGSRGFGLGLAIARRAVEAHGGTVSASNRDGGGLCVEVVLPMDGDVDDGADGALGGL